MALSNGLKLALDWVGLASDWIGLEHCHEIAVGYMSFSVSVVLSLGFSYWELCSGDWLGVD